MKQLEKSYQLFLTKKQVDKLRLFRRILVEKSVSVKLLSQTINKSPAQVRLLIEEIVAEKRVRQNQTVRILQVNENIVSLDPNFKQEQALIFFLKLRKLFYEESPYYQMLIYLLEKRSVKMVELSQALMFSASYCYKLLTYLDGLFSEQKMPIKIKKNVSSIDLIGEESCIRMYTYLLEIIAKNAYVDLEIQAEIASVAGVYEFSTTTKIKHDLMSNIVQNAKKHDCFVQIDSPDASELFRCIQLTTSNQQEIKKSGDKQEKMHSEDMYFTFWSLLFIPEVLYQAQKSSIVQQVSQLKGNTYVCLAQELLIELEQTHPLSQKEKELVLFETIIHLLGYQYLAMGRFVTPETKISNPKVKEIKEQIEKVLSKTDNLIANRPLFSVKLAQILFSYISLSNFDVVSIAITTLNKPDYNVLIKNVLRKTYNAQSLIFTDDLSKADILISDGLVTASSKQQFIYLEDVHNQAEWQQLNQLIQSNILEKCI